MQTHFLRHLPIHRTSSLSLALAPFLACLTDADLCLYCPSVTWPQVPFLCPVICSTSCSQHNTSSVLILHRHKYSFPLFFNSVINEPMCCVYLCYRRDFQSSLVLPSIEVNGSITLLINLNKPGQHGLPSEIWLCLLFEGNMLN